MNNLILWLPLCKVLLLLSLELSAQDYQFVSHTERSVTEEYYVLTSDPKIKHGTYVKYIKSYFSPLVLLENGNYDHGEMSGKWQYYYHSGQVEIFGNRNNSLREEGSFANGKKNGMWITYYIDTARNEMNFQTQNEGEKKVTEVRIVQKGLKPFMAGIYLNDKRVNVWVTFNFNGEIIQKYNYTTSTLLFDKDLKNKDSLKYNTERPPVFVGGNAAIEYFIFKVHKLSLKNIAESDSSGIVMSFLIDHVGKLKSTQVVRAIASHDFKREIMRVSDLLVDNWAPGIHDGQPVESSAKISFSIYRDKHSSHIMKILIEPLRDQ